MTPWQKRVVKELADLNTKIDALENFLSSDSYAALEEHPQRLLDAQWSAMQDYAKALDDRIAEFSW